MIVMLAALVGLAWLAYATAAFRMLDMVLRIGRREPISRFDGLAVAGLVALGAAAYEAAVALAR